MHQEGVAASTIYIVEPDQTTRQGLCSLLATLCAEIRTYTCAAEFLRDTLAPTPSCLVCELDLPDMSGLELLEQLRHRHIRLPALILARDGDIPSAVRAMRAGAVDFIEKPFADRVLVQRARNVLRGEYAEHI